MVCGALACFDYSAFEQLVSSECGMQKVRYLKDISMHSDFLRLVLIKWYLEGNVTTDDLFCERGKRVTSLIKDGLPVSKPSNENDHATRQPMVDDSDSQSRTTTTSNSAEESLITSGNSSSQEHLFNLETISASDQLSYLFGFKWKQQSSIGKHFKYQYVCEDQNCSASFLCSLVIPIKKI